MIELYRVTKIFTFEAAHKLEKGYLGKCSKLHGHSYKVEATFEGEELDQYDMLVDFARIKCLANKYVIDKYDHTVLNDSLTVCTFNDRLNPTAEVMAKRFFQSFEDAISVKETRERDVHVTKVRVWETADSFAEYTEER